MFSEFIELYLRVSRYLSNSDEEDCDNLEYDIAFDLSSGELSTDECYDLLYRLESV